MNNQDALFALRRAQHDRVSLRKLDELPAAEPPRFVQSVSGEGDVVTGRVGHRFEAGARAHHDGVRRHHSEDAFLVVDGELVPESAWRNTSRTREITCVASSECPPISKKLS